MGRKIFILFNWSFLLQMWNKWFNIVFHCLLLRQKPFASCVNVPLNWTINCQTQLPRVNDRYFRLRHPFTTVTYIQQFFGFSRIGKTTLFSSHSNVGIQIFTTDTTLPESRGLRSCAPESYCSTTILKLPNWSFWSSLSLLTPQGEAGMRVQPPLELNVTKVIGSRLTSYQHGTHITICYLSGSTVQHILKGTNQFNSEQMFNFSQFRTS